MAVDGNWANWYIKGDNPDVKWTYQGGPQVFTVERLLGAILRQFELPAKSLYVYFVDPESTIVTDYRIDDESEVERDHFFEVKDIVRVVLGNLLPSQVPDDQLLTVFPMAALLDLAKMVGDKRNRYCVSRAFNRTKSTIGVDEWPKSQLILEYMACPIAQASASGQQLWIGGELLSLANDMIQSTSKHGHYTRKVGLWMMEVLKTIDHQGPTVRALSWASHNGSLQHVSPNGKTGVSDPTEDSEMEIY